MNQKQSCIQHLNTKGACQNLKKQKFVGFCKESIFEIKDENIVQTCSDKKGILLLHFEKNKKLFKICNF